MGNTVRKERIGGGGCQLIGTVCVMAFSAHLTAAIWIPIEKKTRFVLTR